MVEMRKIKRKIINCFLVTPDLSHNLYLANNHEKTWWKPWLFLLYFFFVLTLYIHGTEIPVDVFLILWFMTIYHFKIYIWACFEFYSFCTQIKFTESSPADTPKQVILFFSSSYVRYYFPNKIYIFFLGQITNEIHLIIITNKEQKQKKKQHH
jgi:hypothetical protein